MSIQIGIHTGPQEIEFEELSRLWKRADDARFHWISVWDHFYANPMETAKEPCFEGVAAMAALAAMTQHVRVGCLVFCSLFRSPGLLAKAAVTVDHISNGRAELGMGAGWLKQEFEDFGYDFPSLGKRLDQTEEAVQIVRSLLSGEPTSFSGDYYQVQNALCTPKPKQDKLRIWIGGRGERRTPMLAAKHGDGFNIPYVSPEGFRERNDTVDRFCEEIGRDPAEIERTINVAFYMGADEAGAKRNRKLVPFGDDLRGMGVLTGTAPEVVDRIGEYADKGAAGLNLAFRPPIDWDAFESFISDVLPHFHK